MKTLKVNVCYKKPPKIVQKTIICGLGHVTFGDKNRLGLLNSPNLNFGEIYLEARSIDSKIIIKDGVYINNNASIIADKSTITIGEGTLIGTNFICYDSNFHSLDPENRLSDDYKCSPVDIKENVFIGSNVIVLRGVTIGRNSVIGAGCVVSSDVPENSILSVKQAQLRPLLIRELY